MVGYQKYQANQVEGSGPLGLVLLTYEAMYKSLIHAHRAIEGNDIAEEVKHVSRAQEAIIELSSSLDMQQGGEVAKNLAQLYLYMYTQLSEGMCRSSTQSVDEVMKLAQSLREGWQSLEAKKNHNDSQIQPLPTAFQQQTSKVAAYAR